MQKLNLPAKRAKIITIFIIDDFYVHSRNFDV